jgi:F0F1-type ATP synthase assembly protein I
VETPNRSSGQKNQQPTPKLLITGFEFGCTVAIFCYIGYKLDAKWQTSPYFLLGGFFLSFAGMLYSLFKQMRNTRQK